jgi:DNA ligase D-like protein (predicted 3'-phosphoesterase)
MPRFVIQQHDASSLHYDFRLEHDGVYRSWAVPKVLSTDPRDKRLAMEVEDHPISWGDFEGRIASGYGKGNVIIWDRGEYTLERGDLDKGPATVCLHGEKLNGCWSLRRWSGDDRKWLVVKKRDEWADAPEPGPESVVSGRTVQEVG